MSVSCRFLAVGVLFLELELSPALKTLAEEPPGMTALSLRPSRSPPPKFRVVDQFAEVTLPTSIS
jgi:hypothetical protein